MCEVTGRHKRLDLAEQGYQEQAGMMSEEDLRNKERSEKNSVGICTPLHHIQTLP